MTLTYRNTKRVYQRSAYGAPGGVISNPLPRVSGTGTLSIASEADRQRIHAAPSTFTADHEGRLVSFTSSPSYTSAGANIYQNWTAITGSAAGDGSYIDLIGFRTDLAGSVSYTLHAAADFTDLTANFPADEAPAAVRTNSGPVLWQSIYISNSTNPTLSFLPFTVTHRHSATSVRIAEMYRQLATIPTESSLRWELRDRPAHTFEELFQIMHNFVLAAGWELWQVRGRNTARNIHRDVIYRSQREDGGSNIYLRLLAGGNGAVMSSLGGGVDFALWSAWDRDLDLTSTFGGLINNGNGINSCTMTCNQSAIVSTANSWARYADGTNATTSSQHYCCISSSGNSTQNAGVGFNTNTIWSGNQNLYSTLEGGMLQEISYVFFGDKDSLDFYLTAPGGGGMNHYSTGFLSPRPEANPLIYRLRSNISNGSNVVLRVGGPQLGDPAYPSNGEDPQSPSSGPAYQVGDSIQVVGQTVLGAPSAVGAVSTWGWPGERIESSTITAFPGVLAARGTITCPVAADIADGETVTIHDGTSAYVFEFDKNGSFTDIQVNLSGLTTANEVRDALISAINGSAIEVTASNGGAGIVALVNDTVGGAGNVTITETVTNAGFIVDGMNGGGYSIEVAALAESYRAGALVGEDPQPAYIASLFMTPTSTVDITQYDATSIGVIPVTLLNRARGGAATYRDGPAPNIALTPANNAFGHSALLTKVGASSSQELNPSSRTGRFALMPLTVRDYSGAQLRGRLKSTRLMNWRGGTEKVVRDRTGGYHVLVMGHAPLQLTAANLDAVKYSIAFGPMPRGMAVSD